MKTRSVLLATLALLTLGCTREPAAPTAAVAPTPVGMPWSAQADDWAQKKAALQALGEQFDSSSALYQKLKADAGGGKPLTWAQLGEPAYDWSGIYTRTKGALQFDPDLPMTVGPASVRRPISSPCRVAKTR